MRSSFKSLCFSLPLSFFHHDSEHSGFNQPYGRFRLNASADRRGKKSVTQMRPWCGMLCRAQQSPRRGRRRRREISCTAFIVFFVSTRPAVLLSLSSAQSQRLRGCAGQRNICKTERNSVGDKQRLRLCGNRARVARLTTARVGCFLFCSALFC